MLVFVSGNSCNVEGVFFIFIQVEMNGEGYFVLISGIGGIVGIIFCMVNIVQLSFDVSLCIEFCGVFFGLIMSNIVIENNCNISNVERDNGVVLIVF